MRHVGMQRRDRSTVLAAHGGEVALRCRAFRGPQIRDGARGRRRRGRRRRVGAAAAAVLAGLPGAAAAVAVLPLQDLVLALLADPPVPDGPAEKGGKAAPTHDGDGRHALGEDADEADDEDGDGAHLLDDDGGVGHERPELVGLQARVALQAVEESGLVRVVVRVRLLHPQDLLPVALPAAAPAPAAKFGLSAPRRRPHIAGGPGGGDGVAQKAHVIVVAGSVVVEAARALRGRGCCIDERVLGRQVRARRAR